MDQNKLDASCRRITKCMRILTKALSNVENNPDDEYAYTIMYEIGALAAAMDKAREAGSDDHGNDVLDSFEAVANAIRAAKEAS